MNFEEKLALEQDRLDDLMTQWEDPELSKDISENTPREILSSQITQQEQLVNKLLKYADIPHIPGTWNINDVIEVEFKKVVAYGVNLETPEKKRMILSPFVEVSDIDLEDKTKPIPLAADSALGKAILHKSHTEIRFKTTVGYAEVLIKRCIG